MRKCRYSLPILLGALATLLLAPAVMAYSYFTTITVQNASSNNYTMLPIITTVNNTALAGTGYMLSSGLDTRVMKGSTEAPHMVVEDRTLFASAVAANSSANFDYTMGNALLTAFAILTGYSGNITRADDPDLELGSNFWLRLYAYIDTTVGVDNDIFSKDSAYRTYVSSPGNVRFSITGGGTVNAASTAVGLRLLDIISDATNLYFYVDGVLKDTQALGAAVPDNGSQIVIGRNNVVPYGVYYKIWTR